MHDVDRRPSEARKVERAADSLLLDERRARARVGVDTEVAGGTQPLAQHLDRSRVLAVQPWHDPVLAPPQQRTHEDLVVGIHAELAVGEKELDASHALRGECGERGLVQRTGLVDRGERLDATGGAGGRGHPARAGVLHALTRLGGSVGFDRGRPRAQRGRGCIGQPLVDVGVRIEAARQHIAATRIQLPCAGRRLADRHHAPALDQDVGAVEHPRARRRGRPRCAAPSRGLVARENGAGAHDAARDQPLRGVLGDPRREPVLAVGEREAAPLQLEQAEIAGRPGRQCPSPAGATRARCSPTREVAAAITSGSGMPRCSSFESVRGRSCTGPAWL